jgi:flagellin
MPSAISGGSRIRTNTPAENAYNALQASSNNIALRQLRLSTGKRINSAADDVAGYITSRSLAARNSALKTALNAVGEAKNVTAITQDALDNINGLLNGIKESASTASAGALGTDEKISLSKSAYRLAQQIQFVVDSTVFGGSQLLQGSYTGSWVVGYYSNNNVLSVNIDLTNYNPDYNTSSIKSDGMTKEVTNRFNLNATSEANAVTVGAGNTSNFAGVSGLNLESLNEVGKIVNGQVNLGVFSITQMTVTLTSLAEAINNVNKVATYLGGIQNRLDSQEELLKSQTTNYNAAISRIEDTDVATEQLQLIKAQFLQQASLISLTQANQTPSSYLQLFR